MHSVHSIPGGIHPPENKTQSLGKAIAPLPLPARLVLPMGQHIGAPAKPLVAVGDRVLKGQPIADAAGFVSAPIHAPTSGTVTAIDDQPVPHPSGMKARCISIEPDGKEEWIVHQGVGDYTALDKAELLELIRSAGIVGMGGAGFPSAVKLATDKPIESLIINGTECEPYITADDMLMRERAADIIAGARILGHLIKPGETLIGIEDNKPEAIAIMRQAAEGSGIEIVTFPTKYPSGGEKQLIQIVTGKEVPSGGLPADIGIVMQNVGTTAAIYRAVVHGEPLISRITTVTGDAVAVRGNFEVLLGTPIQHLLEHCEFDAGAASRLIMGGPMMGFALENTGIPIVKTSNCILAPSRQELPGEVPAQACIRCAMCAQACPVSLLPQQLYWFARGKEIEKLEAHQLFDCIECGCCSYVCPSNIPLVQYYRAAKANINKHKQDNQRSEIAKARFEARQQRLDREQAAKDAKRKARAEKAKRAKAAGGDAKADVVQAAIARSAAKKASQDPAQAAIERAKSARSGGQPATTPEQKIAKLEQRLATAIEKRELAKGSGSDKLDAFEASVTTLEAKLATARSELPAQTVTTPKAKVPDSDPAQAAIERAMAKRAGGAPSESPEQKLAKMEKRLATTRKKLAQAQAEGSEHVEILQQSVQKMEQKLEQAQRQLAENT